MGEILEGMVVGVHGVDEKSEGAKKLKGCPEVALKAYSGGLFL